MSKVYSIESTQENKIRECCPFDIQDQDMFNGYSTYNEVLKILREAFKMVDITKIIGKS
jgi:hypothetical protein